VIGGVGVGVVAGGTGVAGAEWAATVGAAAGEVAEVLVGELGNGVH
jgi:hypothetical protein